MVVMSTSCPRASAPATSGGMERPPISSWRLESRPPGTPAPPATEAAGVLSLGTGTLGSALGHRRPRVRRSRDHRELCGRATAQIAENAASEYSPVTTETVNIGTVPTAQTKPERNYTIDELAAAAGLPSRTVRHYQSEGVLPSPRREGRVAVYAASHLERLQLIGRLQDRGLRLDAIRDVLRQ